MNDRDTLKSGRDLTHETLAKLCHRHAVAPINHSFALLPRHEYDRLKAAAIDAAPAAKWLIPPKLLFAHRRLNPFYWYRQR